MGEGLWEIHRIVPPDIGDIAGGLRPKGAKPAPTKEVFH